MQPIDQQPQKRDDVDQASLDSFPASDPPAWNNTSVDIAAPKPTTGTDKAQDRAKAKMPEEAHNATKLVGKRHSDDSCGC